MPQTNPLDRAFTGALDQARRHYRAQAWAPAFSALERAHVLGQQRIGRHARVHLWMLRVAWKRRDAREMLGQLMRLGLVPLGHLTGRLPLGNTGGADVGAFQPMPIPDELRALLRTAPKDGRKRG